MENGAKSRDLERKSTHDARGGHLDLLMGSRLNRWGKESEANGLTPCPQVPSTKKTLGGKPYKRKRGRT